MSTSSTDAAANTDDFMRVSAAKQRYLSGAMSLRWWYRQIELGRLPHFRAGGSVLLRPADVEAFVAEMFRERKEPDDEVEPPPEPAQAPPVATARKRSTRGGLRFFTD